MIRRSAQFMLGGIQLFWNSGDACLYSIIKLFGEEARSSLAYAAETG